jgi:hypothetical protein
LQRKLQTRVSAENDESIQRVESQQFEIEFQTDYDTSCKMFQTYDNNQIKAYALLWERCAKAMKNKIEARADFDSIKNDPMRLLKAIKEHALNYLENGYFMAIILDNLRTLLNTKQRGGGRSQDFTKRIRVSRDILK